MIFKMIYRYLNFYLLYKDYFQLWWGGDSPRYDTTEVAWVAVSDDVSPDHGNNGIDRVWAYSQESWISWLLKDALSDNKISEEEYKDLYLRLGDDIKLMSADRINFLKDILLSRKELYFSDSISLFRYILLLDSVFWENPEDKNNPYNDWISWNDRSEIDALLKSGNKVVKLIVNWWNNSYSYEVLDKTKIPEDYLQAWISQKIDIALENNDVLNYYRDEVNTILSNNHLSQESYIRLYIRLNWGDGEVWDLERLSQQEKEELKAMFLDWEIKFSDSVSLFRYIFLINLVHGKKWSNSCYETWIWNNEKTDIDQSFLKWANFVRLDTSWWWNRLSYEIIWLPNWAMDQSWSEDATQWRINIIRLQDDVDISTYPESVQDSIRSVWKKELDYFFEFFGLSEYDYWWFEDKIREIQSKIWEIEYWFYDRWEDESWFLWPKTLWYVYENYYSKDEYHMPEWAKLRWDIYKELRDVYKQRRLDNLGHTALTNPFENSAYYWVWWQENMMRWDISASERVLSLIDRGSLIDKWLIDYINNWEIELNHSDNNYAIIKNIWWKLRFLYYGDNWDLEIACLVSTWKEHDDWWWPTPLWESTIIGTRHINYTSNSYWDSSMPFWVKVNNNWIFIHYWYTTWEAASHWCIRLPYLYAHAFFEKSEKPSSRIKLNVIDNIIT